MPKNNSTKKYKVCLTGGHAATSALAVIEKLQEQHPDWKIMWVGSQSAFAKEKATTLDFQLFPKMGVKCFAIKSGKLQRKLAISTIVDLGKVPVGLFQAINILRKQRPSVILSFGGYAALPVAWAGKLLGIPVLIHEQTVAIGLANKLSLPFVKEVLLSRQESKKYFSNNKTRYVGLPLHNATKAVKSVRKDKPSVLYVTGGSRGSQTINQAVKQILPLILKSYKVIHQSGSLDIEEFKSYKKLLPAKIRNNYEVFAHIFPLDITKVYEDSDIIVARAGAHTTAEVIALGKAAIFVPIPWVQMNEQMLNAKLAEKYAKSLIIEEANLNTDSLLEAIRQLEKDWKKLKISKENDISVKDRNAADEIVSVMEEYV